MKISQISKAEKDVEKFIEKMKRKYGLPDEDIIYLIKTRRGAFEK